MPLIQDVPMLTVYRTGLINLNGEATRLMHERHIDVDLLPPSRNQRGNRGGHNWQLDRRAGSPSKLLRGGRNGTHLRFPAPLRVAELFRSLPADVIRVIFRITPNTQHLDMYELVAELPVSNHPAALQHNPARKAV